ncbi:MAG TPA: Ig-like domain-containing protein, partial [Steroidobacteraceae bacterium]|nr:Ig-like domain-containing protein [Steroidobacteraceae bacterium]
NTTQNLTNSVVWTSTAPVFAPVSNAPPFNGLASAAGVGTASIKAIDPASHVMSPSVPITITQGLYQIQISAVEQSNTSGSLSFAQGTTLHFIATGFYSNSPSLDITRRVTWSSSGPAIASISNTSPSNGVVTGLTVGTVSIAATSGNVSSSSTNETVTPGTPLVSVAVTPINASISIGSDQQFTAVGTYQDGATFDITDSTTWTSSDPLVLSFNPSFGGSAFPFALGRFMIFATDPATGIVSPPVTLMVTAVPAPPPAALATIAIYVNAIPPSGNLSFSQGATLQYYATATYTDGTTRDITTAVSWTSNAPTVASISNTSPSNGLVTGLSRGTASITATSGNITSFASVVGVTPMALMSIAIMPANPSILRQSYEKFTAIGIYRDGTTYDITDFVTWASSNTAVAYINSTGAFIGQAFGESVGQTSIRGTEPQTGIISPATTLTVRP